MVNFAWVEASSKSIKLKNLLNTWIFLWFVWILFHFTIVFFFWIILKSILLTWVFLAIGSWVALLVDIPVWVLQKYVKPKTFIVAWTVFMFIACLIFLKFIYFEWILWAILPDGKGWWSLEKWASYLWIFFDSWLNIVLLTVAAALYWMIKEAYDITMLSYIFNNTTPTEYAKYISGYNIRFWIWSWVWLVSSWIMLAFDIRIAIVIFIVIVVMFLLFLLKFFDNWKYALWLDSFKKIRVDSFKPDLGNQKNKISEIVSTKNLIQITEKTKVIFLKPIELKNSIDFSDVAKTTKEAFKNFFKMITWQPTSIVLMWIISLVMFFSFWDNFVATFQIEFLEQLIKNNQWEAIISRTKWLITGYVLLWIMIIPAYLCQDFFVKMSKKFWQFNIIMFGSVISAISLICFCFFSSNLYLVMLFWLLNSVWYAAVFPISQAVFSERYNILYAERYKLKQIDSSSAAAPLMIVLNAANVIWLLLGALIVNMIWFEIFFLILWFFLLSVFAYSIVKYSDINDKKTGKKDEKQKEEKVLNEFDWEVF